MSTVNSPPPPLPPNAMDDESFYRHDLDPRSSALDLEDWMQKWTVVTSTQTRIYRAIALHAGIVILSLAMALGVGINGKATHNGESLCFLRHRPSLSSVLDGESSACSKPIVEACFSIFFAILLCAYNVRSLIVYKPRDRRVMLAEVAVSGALCALMIWNSAWVARSKDITCDDLYTKNRVHDCGNEFKNTYHKSLGGLVFGIVMGFFSAILWGVSAFIEWKAYKSQDSI
ncbi:hypothetical protein PhCBS80983_g04742 [Powellomyces hirtus]|uniref:MARVEL domain-containing protein n=1 Tax=Powellomyces hirtus TaxID=109895 RepID=A0A507DXB6_9FUNG|nr:hypothetical protein PhCBS80983_g04742 [Powellomyces hirtus]